MNAKAQMSQWRCRVSTGATLTRFGEIPNYEEGLYEISRHIYAWMVPNGSWGETNAGLIVGKGESLLVDTLWDVTCTQQMLTAMEPVTSKCPINYVVNTHSDGDHFWGNQLLESRDIYATEACLSVMNHMQPKSLNLFGNVGKVLSHIPFGGCNCVGNWFHGMASPYNYKNVILTPANKTFTGELTLSVGGREVVIYEVGPAHTSGDALVYIPDNKTLFAGDLLFIGSTPVLWAGPSENWIKALDDILRMDVEAIIPGHGPIADKEGVQQVKDYWEFVNGAVYERHRAGLTAAEAARSIALSDEFRDSPFSSWDSPERLMTSAHTIYRHFDGKGDSFFSTPQMVGIMAKQAILAHDMPWATPSRMHNLR